MKSEFSSNKIRSQFILGIMYFGVFVLCMVLLPLYLINAEYSYYITRKIGTFYVVNLYRLFGLQIFQEGEIPNRQVVIVSNHYHNFETMLLPTITKTKTTYITKQFSKVFICLRDFIVVRGRDKVSTSKFLSRIKQECILYQKSVVIFPEGKRVELNEKVEYQTTGALLGRYLNLPIVPISINTGYVFESAKSPNLDFSKPIKLKVHESLFYEDILFRSLYFSTEDSPHKNSSKLVNETTVHKDCDNISIDKLKTVIINLSKIDIQSKKLIQHILQKIEILSYLKEYSIKRNQLTKEMETLLSDFDLPRSSLGLICQDLASKISAGYEILFTIIPGKDNKEKDTIVTKWIEKKIAESIVPV